MAFNDRGGARIVVAAPSSIPRKPGDRIKTDRTIGNPVFDEADQPILVHHIEGSRDTLPISAIIRIM